MNFYCKRKRRREKNATKLFLKRLQRFFNRVRKNRFFDFLRRFSVFTLNRPTLMTTKIRYIPGLPKKQIPNHHSQNMCRSSDHQLEYEK